MKNALVGFVLGVPCFFGAGAMASQFSGSSLSPFLQAVHPFAVVIFFCLGALLFAGAFDRLTEWQEAKGSSCPASSSAIGGWEVLFIILSVFVPGTLFTLVGTLKEGNEIPFLVSCAILGLFFYLSLHRFKPLID